MRSYYSMALMSAALLAGSAFAEEAVPVVSGGVGESSQELIEAQQQNYNLKLVYTGEGGMYLSDVQVKIRDSKGLEIVNGVTNGPFLLAELEPGRYTVESATDGFQKKQTVTVGPQLKTVNIPFPVKDDGNNIISWNKAESRG